MATAEPLLNPAATGGAAVPLVLDGTGLTTSVPLLIKNAKQLSGVELQVTGTAATGYLLRDAAGVQKAVLGYAVSNNDWVAGALAGYTVLNTAGGLYIRPGSGGNVQIVSPGAVSNVSVSDSGASLGFGAAYLQFTSGLGTVNGPLAISASTSLSTVALQITGDPNTGIGAIGGADTLSVVAGGVEQVRVSTTLMTVNGKLSIPTAQTQATIGANGGAAALTVLPVGYIKVDINGAAMIVPYYNA